MNGGPASVPQPLLHARGIQRRFGGHQEERIGGGHRAPGPEGGATGEESKPRERRAGESPVFGLRAELVFELMVFYILFLASKIDCFS
jgi:hypothetical protein